MFYGLKNFCLLLNEFYTRQKRNSSVEKDVLWPSPSVKSTDQKAFDTGFLPKVPSPRGPEPSRKPLADYRGISEVEVQSGGMGFFLFGKYPFTTSKIKKTRNRRSNPTCFARRSLSAVKKFFIGHEGIASFRPLVDNTGASFG